MSTPAPATPAPDTPVRRPSLPLRALASARRSLLGGWTGQFCVVRILFPRLLALVFVAAFASWLVQMDGLVGSQGILPAGQQMENTREQAAAMGFGRAALFFRIPTIFWLWHYTDGVGHAVCWMGIVMALLAIVGFFQGPLLLGMSFLYLSLANTGGIFMGYQWDALLVESGFVAAWFAPWRWWSGRWNDQRRGGSRLALFLLHFLLFKLMFMSGYVKPASGDPTWVNATALSVHYETQPLPTWIGWWAHQLPVFWQKACCWVMYFIELALPFVIFLGRRPRLAAAAGFCGLMIVILLTGNFTYFNYLAIFLALTLLDDCWWPRPVRKWLRIPENSPPRPARRWLLIPHIPVAAAWLVLSLTVMALDTISRGRHESRPAWARSVAEKLDRSLPDWARTAYNAVNPFNIANSYGLFADMTTERYELCLEVSVDGDSWQEVPCKSKPVDPSDRPRFVAPHQPRLDWQLWFAAPWERFDPRYDATNPRLYWLYPFCEALLQHRQPVWDLLGKPPIPVDQVKFIRFQRYRYQFTTPAQRRETGAWWKREQVSVWTPELSLKQPSPQTDAAP